MTLRIRSANEVVEELLAADPLREFFTWWDRVEKHDLERLEGALASVKSEEDIQQHLQANPHLLIQHLGGGHGRWVIPKARLGADHVTDFLVAEKHSFGYEWQAVELESPLRPMFNRAGDPSRYLTHAVRQITDWRVWLKSNQAYAARPRSEHGLGLTEIDANVKGLILIGRRGEVDPETAARRRQMVQDLNIEIHSFDYLLAALRGKLAARERPPEGWPP